VRAINDYIALQNTGFAEQRMDLAGNVNHLTSLPAVYIERFFDNFHPGTFCEFAVISS
jgi:hypothetical protein